MNEPRPATISALPFESRSSVANSWNTRTGSAALRTVTALVRRIRRVRAAAAARTRRIRLTSAVTVLSAADPVRVFQEFATLDLLSHGRAEIVAGRGSFIEAFPLFGLELEDYDSLFAEKLDLLLRIRENTHVHWSGRHRPALTGQGVYPRPWQNLLPIWLGVGGTPGSFIRAGTLGLPLMVAIIGGEPHRFRPLIDRYRQAGLRAGHSPDRLKVASIR